MADTKFLVVDINDWTLVAAGPENGYISNNSENTVYLVERASAPGSALNKGHKLLGGDDIRYEIIAGSNVWARARDVFGTLAVTPD